MTKIGRPKTTPSILCIAGQYVVLTQKEYDSFRWPDGVHIRADWDELVSVVLPTTTVDAAIAEGGRR